MSDLVKRLQDAGQRDVNDRVERMRLFADAGYEIERLRTKLERIEQIADAPNLDDEDDVLARLQQVELMAQWIKT